MYVRVFFSFSGFLGAAVLSLLGLVTVLPPFPSCFSEGRLPYCPLESGRYLVKMIYTPVYLVVGYFMLVFI